MNKDFIKVGNRILLSRKGLDYDLKSGHVYNLMYERYEGFGYLEEDGKLTTPNRIYSSGIENELIDRVLTYFHDNNKSVGVLLEGLKGSGKTLTCKRIANRSELPIIVVDAMFPSVKLTEFFTKVTTDVVIIFDEVEKNRNWNSEDLLSFLDGIQDTCKKIVLMTCNKSTDLSNYLKDRCSRIRYKMHFDGLSNELIKEVVNDKISDKKLANKLYNYISDNFSVKSYDNIIEFINECLTFSNKNIEDLVKLMNIEVNDNIYNRDRKITKTENRIVDTISEDEPNTTCIRDCEELECCCC